jgi:UDP-3-O-acyl N-acetylglucosamine deacetylase
MDGTELPGLDGSAKGFVEALISAGVSEQDAPKKVLELDTAFWCEDKDSFLGIIPAGDMRVSYTLSYNDPAIGTQFFSIAVDEDAFKKEIAPARTFCLEQEAMQLLKMGLGKGANYDNTLVMGKDGPVGNRLRFPDEPVRHKILDLMGDLLVLGCAVKGHIVAVKSGHRLNMELVKKLKRLII